MSALAAQAIAEQRNRLAKATANGAELIATIQVPDLHMACHVCTAAEHLGAMAHAQLTILQI